MKQRYALFALYILMGYLYTGKTASLYWDGPLWVRAPRAPIQYKDVILPV